jgi:hypothetical protein
MKTLEAIALPGNEAHDGIARGFVAVFINPWAFDFDPLIIDANHARLQLPPPRQISSYRTAL